MTLIVSQNGKDAKRVPRTSFGNEAELQQYIHENPDAIPLYEIQEDIQLLIVAREFPTKSGPIDAVGIDSEGQLYLIETKLYKNQDKRHVVAQVLDYGASLWRHYGDFVSFEEELEKQTQRKWGMGIREKIAEFFDLPIEEASALLENTRSILDEGTFQFVVLMDQLHSQLKDLILFLNQYSRFSVYAVEVEYYKHNSYEIMIPRLFGSQVKKESGVSRPRQMKEYSLEDHFSGDRETLRPLFDQLITGITTAEPDIEVRPAGKYIGCKLHGRVVLSVDVLKDTLKMGFWSEAARVVDDPKKKLIDHHGRGYRMVIQNEEDVAYALRCAQQMLDAHVRT